LLLFKYYKIIIKRRIIIALEEGNNRPDGSVTKGPSSTSANNYNKMYKYKNKGRTNK
jgi:hypothetical protein